MLARKARPSLPAQALRVAIAVLAAGVLGAGAMSPAGAPLDGPFAQDFSPLTPPVPAPLEVFEDLQGNPVRLADFEGRVVLLNFWATWCAPCIREMPALDRLQALLEAEGLTVAAVSIDRGGAGVVAPFVEKLGIAHMAIFIDAKSALARAFAISGLPATFLIDARGQVVRGKAGPAEWDSPEAVALIRHYLAKGGEAERQDAATQ